jgi:hypothetical protein
LIYEYALSEDGGLFGDVISQKDSWIRFRAATEVRNGGQESNQLRYVCRQLYMETNGLGLRYNDFTFMPRSGEPSVVRVYDHFDQFVHYCSPRHLAKIKHITLLENETDTKLDLIDGGLASLLSIDVVRFCQKYLTATVVVRFNWRIDTSEIAYGDCMDAMLFFLRGVSIQPD